MEQKRDMESFGKNDVANTVADSPIEFLASSIVAATTHLYVRRHGRGKSIWYDYTHSKQELPPWLGKLGEMEEKVPVVYAYFNNHTGTPGNLLQLLEMRGEISNAQMKVRARAEPRERKKAIKKITDF